MSILPESVSKCPRLKVLRLEENCLEISAFTPQILKHSQIALLAIEGNVFDVKQFNNREGYDEVMFVPLKLGIEQIHEDFYLYRVISLNWKKIL